MQSRPRGRRHQPGRSESISACPPITASFHMTNLLRFSVMLVATLPGLPASAQVFRPAGPFDDIAVGFDFGCGVKRDGTVHCWGKGNEGQRGDGDTGNRSTPSLVAALDPRAVSISASSGHACAALTNGRAYCWGRNSSGQLGDGTTTSRTEPVPVDPVTGLVRLVATGRNHSCAINHAGAVLCWGSNNFGQLGGAPGGVGLTPVVVAGAPPGVSDIALGDGHGCLLTESGEVHCWGGNGSGQLGVGDRVSRQQPERVSGIEEPVFAIETGALHTCAVTVAGRMYCWGSNGDLQLGQEGPSSTWPSSPTGFESGVRGIALGDVHTCALTDDRNVFCWGAAELGQTGSELFPTTSGPALVELPFAPSAISAGGRGACSVSSTGLAACWGENADGGLGNGHTTVSRSPVRVRQVRANRISSGWTHTCGLNESGELACWGDNRIGQLGDGTTNIRRIAVPIPGSSAAEYSLMGLGGYVSCAVTHLGAADCWGYNSYGGLGDGSVTARLTPTAVLGLPVPTDFVATGGFHSCAIASGGAAYCWGLNSRGQLGNDGVTPQTTPLAVTGLGAGTQTISAGELFTCAVAEGGVAKCWGDNRFGQLGIGSTGSYLYVPTDVHGLPHGATTITTGSIHACALTPDQRAKCWGNNSYGQLGVGQGPNLNVATEVVGLAPGVRSVVAGYMHSCAITAEKGVACWGWNPRGQLGPGSVNHSPVPVEVPGLANITSLSIGYGHSCAASEAGDVYCWGHNFLGTLGDGGPSPAIPTPVVDSVPGGVFRSSFEAPGW